MIRHTRRVKAIVKTEQESKRNKHRKNNKNQNSNNQNFPPAFSSAATSSSTASAFHNPDLELNEMSFQLRTHWIPKTLPTISLYHSSIHSNHTLVNDAKFALCVFAECRSISVSALSPIASSLSPLLLLLGRKRERHTHTHTPNSFFSHVWICLCRLII